MERQNVSYLLHAGSDDDEEQWNGQCAQGKVWGALSVRGADIREGGGPHEEGYPT